MEAPVAVVVTGGEEDGSRRRKRSWGGGGGSGSGKSAAAGGGVGGGRGGGGLMDGFSFSPASPPRVFWNSRRKSANGRSLQRAIEEENKNNNPPSDTTTSMDSEDNNNPPPKPSSSNTDNAPMEEATAPPLSDRRRALFEPLDSTITTGKRARIPAEELLPPPDFDNLSYPKGWLVGKKRKLVNVDVVESMRRIAVQEMNRKDREIDGLNEQLEEDARCLERLQLQLLEERSKRADVERDNAMLQNQVAMLMDMLQEGEEGDEPHEEEP